MFNKISCSTSHLFFLPKWGRTDVNGFLKLYWDVIDKILKYLKWISWWFDKHCEKIPPISVCVCMCVCAYMYTCASVCTYTQSRPTLCYSMDCSPPGFSVREFSQARILEWVTISCSRRSSLPRVQPMSLVSRALAGSFFTSWATEDTNIDNIVVVQSLSCVWLWPHGLQHVRFPCPSPSPGVCSNSCPLSWWCSLTISSSAAYLFCLQSFPASVSFPVSQLFTCGGQIVGASALVLPMSIQCWFPLGLIGLISLQSKGLSSVFSNTTIQKHQFFGAQPSLWSNSHIHTWLLEKP